MATKADPLSKLYGRRLRSVREERKLRQVDVAAALGMSAGGYSSVERGAARMFVSDLDRYAEALGVDSGYLGRRLGLCGAESASEMRIAEGRNILEQIAGEPPEVADTILQWLRQSIDMAKALRVAQLN